MKVDTTLGDLIVALSDATSQYTSDDNEASILVAYLLFDLLDNSETVAPTWH